MYDQFKYLLLHNIPNLFQDNLLTHFTASTLAGVVATTLTQPLDVLKTSNYLINFENFINLK